MIPLPHFFSLPPSPFPPQLPFRYRAVASWSRVQGIGIPLITAIEIVSIWILSFILAIPEAIGFVMVPFEYKGELHRTCMLNATSKFMEVLIMCQFTNHIKFNISILKCSKA